MPRFKSQDYLLVQKFLFTSPNG